ncbi:hypothetical protein ACRRTK_013018 [Alexandromys fortis]
MQTISVVEILKELDDYYEKFKRETDGTQKRRVLHCIQRALIRSQELGDEKIQIVSQMVELVENRTRQVDSHVELFEAHQDISDSTGGSGKAGQDKSKSETIAQADKPNNKRSRRQRNNENRENASNNHDHDDITSGTPKEKKAKTSKKKKRSKAKAEREASPADLPIDPNEPTYCLCNQVSYGEMIGCDNDECPIEWFHFSCVGLNHKPKGKWYCPKCRGENEKTMDKALEKSKKERAYNSGFPVSGIVRSLGTSPSGLIQTVVRVRAVFLFESYADTTTRVIGIGPAERRNGRQPHMGSGSGPQRDATADNDTCDRDRARIASSG